MSDIDHKDAVSLAQQAAEDISISDWGAASESLDQLNEFVAAQDSRETADTCPNCGTIAIEEQPYSWEYRCPSPSCWVVVYDEETHRQKADHDD